MFDGTARGEVVVRSRLAAAAYLFLVCAAMIAAAFFNLRTAGVFACPPIPDGKSQYLGYCHADQFGDYDHGAFWFGLEPTAVASAASADVLFLGNSRMQFGFSTEATREWFRSVDRRHYLLGFSHGENVRFVGPLLDRIKPRARVYVINVDRFFDDRLTPPARDIAESADAIERYRSERISQQVQNRVCQLVPVACGSAMATYRDRSDGSWQLGGTGDFLRYAAVGEGQPTDQHRWPEFIRLGRAFVDRLPIDRGCIVLTMVPWPESARGEAAAIAEALGLPFISPQISGLGTFDTSHLDRGSAERWSAAFLAAADPVLRRCLAQPSAATS
jgi:hypothetical protein